jgi:regulatory protein
MKNFQMKSPKNITPEEALSRLQNLCSTQEKCSGDARTKLKQWNIPSENHESIIDKLIKDRFIDDTRFVGFFVRDKQNINSWGREKIRFALIQKGLSKAIIDEALGSLPVENFEASLREILERKAKELSKYEPYEKKNRLIRFAVQRGFDYDLIFRLVDDFVRV